MHTSFHDYLTVLDFSLQSWYVLGHVQNRNLLSLYVAGFQIQ